MVTSTPKTKSAVVAQRMLADLEDLLAREPVLRAAARGEAVQVLSYDETDWTESTELEFTLPPGHYRIKPPPPARVFVGWEAVYASGQKRRVDRYDYVVSWHPVFREVLP